MRVSDMVGAVHASRGGGIIRHRSGRAHLAIYTDDGSVVARCGSAMSVKHTSITGDPVLGRGEEWCYSCIGNALEHFERGSGYLH